MKDLFAAFSVVLGITTGILLILSSTAASSYDHWQHAAILAWVAVATMFCSFWFGVAAKTRW